ncbi:MAG TPA: hypothetical protein DDZ51_26005 [Planctomycetaceae bacterium]|nr:hypothetical protein [Planctomycetaceae bacterium]
MSLSSQLEEFLAKLRQQGFPQEMIESAEKILENTYTWEARLVDLARANLQLTDTLLADRQLFEERLKFERHCQNLNGNDP